MFLTTKYRYRDLSEDEAQRVYNDLLGQCNNIMWLEIAFKKAWYFYSNSNSKYDGATFVKEQDGKFWEVSSFIHDMINNMGHIGKEADIYFIKIMVALKYSPRMIFERSKWMQWTWLNVLWHKIKGTYKSDLK